MPLFARSCPDVIFPSAAIVVVWIFSQFTDINFWYSRNTNATNTNPTITNRILTTFLIAYPIRKPLIPPRPAEVAVEVREPMSTTILKRSNFLAYTNCGYFSYNDVIYILFFSYSQLVSKILMSYTGFKRYRHIIRLLNEYKDGCLCGRRRFSCFCNSSVRFRHWDVCGSTEWIEQERLKHDTSYYTIYKGRCPNAN